GRRHAAVHDLGVGEAVGVAVARGDVLLLPPSDVDEALGVGAAAPAPRLRCLLVGADGGRPFDGVPDDGVGAVREAVVGDVELGGVGGAHGDDGAAVLDEPPGE